MIRLRACFALLIAVTPALAAAAIQPVTSGSDLDYQAAILRASSDGARLVVFERLNASVFGDLWLTRSTDEGQSWSAPIPIIASRLIRKPTS